MVEGEDRREPNLGAAKIKSDIEGRSFGVDDGAASAGQQESDAPADEDVGASDSLHAKLMPMWLLIGAVVLAGVVWYFSDQAGDRTGAENSLPVITAEAGPVKVRPEEPGGLDVPNRDKYVYKSLTGESAEPHVEHLLPPPEEPVAVEERADLAAETRVAPSAATETLLGIAGDDQKAGSDAGIEIGNEPVVLIKPKVATATTQSEQAAADPPLALETSQPLETEATELASVTDATSSGLVADNFRVQFASARSREGAVGEWRRLQGRHSELLAELNVRVVRADLADKGVWYRARIGPFSDRVGAEGLCDALKARGVDCFVAKR